MIVVMISATAAVLKQLDHLLSLYDKERTHSGDGYASYKSNPELEVRIRAAIERYAPPDSAYLRATAKSEELMEVGQFLRGLREDYAQGYLRTIGELIHADMFSDFLEMSEHLLSEGYKDAAAVTGGAVLE